MMAEEQKQALIQYAIKFKSARNVYGSEIHEIRSLADFALAALTQPASPALKLPDLKAAEEVFKCLYSGRALSAAINAAKWYEEEAKRRNAPHTVPIEPICATGGAEWVKVGEGLPKRGQRVNAFYLNRLGKGRTIKAEYIYSKTEEAGECDPDTQCVEYCEESDTYFVTEGWYEVMDNWEEYGSIAVTEGNITHWMPLPAAPIS